VKRLDAQQLDAAFDPKHALRWTDVIYKRIFGRPAGKKQTARRRR
jgi:hypothetical protein